MAFTETILSLWNIKAEWSSKGHPASVGVKFYYFYLNHLHTIFIFRFTGSDAPFDGRFSRRRAVQLHDRVQSVEGGLDGRRLALHQRHLQRTLNFDLH